MVSMANQQLSHTIPSIYWIALLFRCHAAFVSTSNVRRRISAETVLYVCIQ